LINFIFYYFYHFKSNIQNMIIISNKMKKAPTKCRRLHQRGVGGVYLDSAKASLDINFSPLIAIV
jgi:hypothetical protein